MENKSTYQSYHVDLEVLGSLVGLVVRLLQVDQAVLGLH